LNYGDLSVLSFHATKVFNTFEGGAIVCRDSKTKQKIDQLKNFGIIDETTVVEPGLNGKMSELNAAFGLLQLQHMGNVYERRKRIDSVYRDLLLDVKGIRCVEPSRGVIQNYSYFPILVESSYRSSRDELYDKLKQNQIFARRYFYPLISEFPMYRGLSSAQSINLPVATELASKVLCLPIYPNLAIQDVYRIVSIIAKG